MVRSKVIRFPTKKKAAYEPLPIAGLIRRPDKCAIFDDLTLDNIGQYGGLVITSTDLDDGTASGSWKCVIAELIAGAALINPEHLEDPHEILKAFINCSALGIYPPTWVMDAITERFDNYLKDNWQGEGKRLGEYFGEKEHGVDKHKFNKYKFENDICWLYFKIDVLVYMLKLKADHAITIVYDTYLPAGNKLGWEKRSTLDQKYYSEGQKKGMGVRLLENPLPITNITKMLCDEIGYKYLDTRKKGIVWFEKYPHLKEYFPPK